MIGTVRQDVRQTMRSLARTPAFTVVAIATLALGIGVTTAIVSVVDHVLLRSLPFRDADRLMMLLERGERGGLRGPSAPTTQDWQQDSGVRQAFESIAFIRGDGVVIASGGTSEHVGAAFVGPEFFPMLGARPVVGR